ncbi:hypothetical protein [Prosthecobacter algae]|uniref:hypothetical protein n=1 Tax=Prosthecobacter algae TaxID=1144682 RepID=UPI0031ECFC71
MPMAPGACVFIQAQVCHLSARPSAQGTVRATFKHGAASIPRFPFIFLTREKWNGESQRVFTEAGGELGGSFMKALGFTTAHPCIFRSTARTPVLALQVTTGIVTGSIHAPSVPPIQKRHLKGGLDHAKAITDLSGYVIGTGWNTPFQIVAPGTTPVLEPAWPQKGRVATLAHIQARKPKLILQALPWRGAGSPAWALALAAPGPPPVIQGRTIPPPSRSSTQSSKASPSCPLRPTSPVLPPNDTSRQMHNTISAYGYLSS